MRYLVGIILTCALLGIIGVYMYVHGQGGSPTLFGEPLLTTNKQSIVSSGRTVPNDALEYRSDFYGFSVLYPNYLQVREYPGGDNTTTLVFQNAEKPAGFQIFILPYSASTISAERFRKDIPSGVQKNLQTIQLSGADGAAFYSQDLALGETYEVWVLHNGWLYEINSLAPLDEWLQSILGTWQFLN
ncbi:hypothetical protein H6783_02255 [Candidatus Nomurabacteria bacterium]|nr:hypothetical protein [Candidatus Nomurabacteria bacterium]